MENLSQRLKDFKKRKLSPMIMAISVKSENSLEESMESMEENYIKKEEMMSCSKTEFLNTIFSTISMVKLFHLETNMYSEHIALNELYDDLAELFDTLVESSQTEEKFRLKHSEVSTETEKSATMFLESTLEFIRNYRCCFTYSYQGNIIDEIETTISKTIYKLKFLK